MQRREFLKLMAASAGATALPLAGNLGCATRPPKSGSSLSGGGSPTSFPVSDWQAVVREGWGTAGAPGRAGHLGRRDVAGAIGHSRSDRRRAVQGGLGFAAHLRCARMVSRRQVRHLGALESAVRAGGQRLVCPQHVYPGPGPISEPSQTLRTSLGIRLQGPVRAMDAAELGTGGAD